MAEFFAMGGHGAYIWACYGLVFIVLVGLLISSIRSMRSKEAMVDLLRQSKRAGTGETGATE